MSARSRSLSPLRDDQADLGYGETDSQRIRRIQSPRPGPDGTAYEPDDDLHEFSHAGSSLRSNHSAHLTAYSGWGRN